MIVHSEDHDDQVSLIAGCLVANFAKPLYDFCKEKNYLIYVESLAEIIEWSYEFCSQYCHKLDDWESFAKSKENIYNAGNRHDFIVAWGHSRMEQFFARHAKQAGNGHYNTTNSGNLSG